MQRPFMRKNHSKIVCIKLVHLPYLELLKPFQSCGFSNVLYRLQNKMKRKLPVVNKIFLFCRLNACSNTKFQIHNCFVYVALCMVHLNCPAEEVEWNCQSLKEEKEIKFKSEECFTQLQVAGFNSSTLLDRHLFYLEPETPIRGVCTE